MSKILEKRTYDARLYDLICTGLLGTTETITSVVSIAADEGGLVFGVPAINTVATTYPDGTTAAIGKVIQVEISGGTLPATANSKGLAVPNLLCTVRAKFLTSQAPNQVEATIQLLLKDFP